MEKNKKIMLLTLFGKATNPINMKCASPLNPITMPSKMWSLVGIDIIGPMQTTASGNKHIVALTDHFSKWNEARAIPNKTAT